MFTIHLPGSGKACTFNVLLGCPNYFFVQARAQFMLGETFVEELRLVETATLAGGSGEALDPRTMGVATTACTPELSPEVAGGGQMASTSRTPGSEHGHPPKV